MLKTEKNGRYADVMERALYNGIISGMQLDGKRFFYVNPLEVNPGVRRDFRLQTCDSGASGLVCVRMLPAEPGPHGDLPWKICVG